MKAYLCSNAYILKALSFGRYVLFFKNSNKMVFSEWHEVGISKFNNCISDFAVTRWNFEHRLTSLSRDMLACRHSSVDEIALTMLMAYQSFKYYWRLIEFFFSWFGISCKAIELNGYTCHAFLNLNEIESHPPNNFSTHVISWFIG